ncbi:MAG: cupin domain-containing protein [Nitrososphaerota archaeon]|nr:cupin domain-containing protein [Nitrososphaerota archaeon]
MERIRQVEAHLNQNHSIRKSSRATHQDSAQAPKIEQLPGLETTILTGLNGEQMLMALNATLPGHSVSTHSHPNEQIGMVHSGRAILRIGDQERVVSKGDFYCIPANVPHSDTCIGDEPFVMLDVFYPIREDFVRKLGQEGHGPDRKPSETNSRNLEAGERSREAI